MKWPGNPPFHWMCRCVVLPVFKSFEDLVSKESKLSKSKIKKLLELPTSQRASFSGPVKGDMDYNDWLKTQSKKDQIDVLGEKRQKLWKDNKLSMVDLVNQKGRLLTLKQLEKKY